MLNTGVLIWLTYKYEKMLDFSTEDAEVKKATEQIKRTNFPTPRRLTPNQKDK